MIKIFRTIRYNLMNENKTGRYLKYAIGEIILVVIGILIALQINNWNENRKNTIIENEYYCQLLEDITSDKNRLEAMKSRLEEVQIKGNQLLRDLDSQTKSKDYLLNKYIEVFRSDNFTLSKIALQDLLSSGNINLLRNKSLKKRIILYYQEAELLAGKMATNNETVLEKNSEISTIDSGWHEMKDSGLDNDVKKLIPINNWHLDKASEIYRQIQDIIIRTIGGNRRKLELIELITQKMQEPLEVLKATCNN